MSTEQATQFQPKALQADTVRPSETSNKEYSGFSHAINIEPITYRPNEAHTGQFAVRENKIIDYTSIAIDIIILTVSCSIRVN